MIMEKHEKFLPLGSVVMLEKGRHRAMIVGYGVKLQSDNITSVYDYMGCLFPEGIFTTEESMAFNHSDIKEVYHLGLVDDEVKKFHIKLNEAMKKINM